MTWSSVSDSLGWHQGDIHINFSRTSPGAWTLGGKYIGQLASGKWGSYLNQILTTPICEFHSQKAMQEKSFRTGIPIERTYKPLAPNLNSQISSSFFVWVVPPFGQGMPYTELLLHVFEDFPSALRYPVGFLGTIFYLLNCFKICYYWFWNIY